MFKKKMLAVITAMSLVISGVSLPGNEISVKAGDIRVASGTPEVRTINLNVKQSDGSYAIAGVSDPVEVAKPTDTPHPNWSDGKGSYVYYGTYQQSEDTANSTLGNTVYQTEPIKWRVLDGDTTDYDDANGNTNHTMFLLSDKVLDQVAFNESTTDGNDYASSNLRKWLNSETFAGTGYTSGGFLNTAFSAAEQKGIAISSKNKTTDTIEAKYSSDSMYKDKSGLSMESNNQDKVFVLSETEASNAKYGFVSRDYFDEYYSTNSLESTEYSEAKSVSNSWWLRCADVADTIKAGYGTNGKLSLGSVDADNVGVAPACNLKLSSVLFTSVSGENKASSFALTSASSSQEWNLTMAGGEGFSASRGNGESGAVKPGDEMTLNIGQLGTPYGGVEYTQISAMLVDQNNTVLAYGKIASKDAGSATVTIPASLSVGQYTLKVFAEDVNSTAQSNLTDFASNMAEIPVTVGYRMLVTNPAGSHITYSQAAGNGAAQQKVAAGAAITSVVYTADSGYYFPDGYSVTGQANGITVTRDNAGQITVKGNLTGDVAITLTAATEKENQQAITGLGEAEGQITGTTTAMEYRVKTIQGSSDTGWADCTGGATTVEPGTYEVRYKETDKKMPDRQQR